jgi:probable phosphoglycerate mutase
VTRVLLVRHAAHDWLGRGLAGRLEGVGLNPAGRQQAGALVERLATCAIDAVYSSPQQRTRETAVPLARARGLPVQIDPAFDEIDFGSWTGRTFQQLQGDGALWQDWVDRRSGACPPGGEPFQRVVARAEAGLDALVRRHPGGTLVVVSHGDVLKGLLARALGMSLDHLERFELAPASVSDLVMEGSWAQVRCINSTAAGP